MMRIIPLMSSSTRLPWSTMAMVVSLVGAISTVGAHQQDTTTTTPDSSSPVDLTAITQALKDAVSESSALLTGGGSSTSDDEDEMASYTLKNTTEDDGPATAHALNVYGDPLLPCSTKGMALTGYTNRGYCEDVPPFQIDAGVVYVESDYLTHNVCIDIPSSKHGIFNCNATTGTPTWCDDSPLAELGVSSTDDKKKSYACTKEEVLESEHLHSCSSNHHYPCSEDKETHACGVENWCICEWAFAMYMDAAGGCSNVANIVCDATNLKVVLHYQESYKNTNDTNAKRALDCLTTQCGTSILT